MCPCFLFFYFILYLLNKCHRATDRILYESECKLKFDIIPTILPRYCNVIIQYSVGRNIAICKILDPLCSRVGDGLYT